MTAQEAQVQADLVAALKACAFQLGVLVAATHSFTDVNARVLDAAQAALAKAEAR